MTVFITKFVTLVTNFVTNFFCADSKKYQAESKNFLPATKKIQAGISAPNPAQMQGCDGFVFSTRHFYSFDI